MCIPCIREELRRDVGSIDRVVRGAYSEALIEIALSVALCHGRNGADGPESRQEAPTALCRRRPATVQKDVWLMLMVAEQQNEAPLGIDNGKPRRIRIFWSTAANNYFDVATCKIKENLCLCALNGTDTLSCAPKPDI